MLLFYSLNSVESGGQIYSIYTDLKKAFDSVNINRLILKLGNLGVGCSWFESYLNYRI